MGVNTAILLNVENITLAYHNKSKRKEVENLLQKKKLQYTILIINNYNYSFVIYKLFFYLQNEIFPLFRLLSSTLFF